MKEHPAKILGDAQREMRRKEAEHQQRIFEERVRRVIEKDHDAAKPLVKGAPEASPQQKKENT